MNLCQNASKMHFEVNNYLQLVIFLVLCHFATEIYFFFFWTWIIKTLIALHHKTVKKYIKNINSSFFEFYTTSKKIIIKKLSWHFCLFPDMVYSSQSIPGQSSLSWKKLKGPEWEHCSPEQSISSANEDQNPSSRLNYLKLTQQKLRLNQSREHKMEVKEEPRYIQLVVV